MLLDGQVLCFNHGAAPARSIAIILKWLTLRAFKYVCNLIVGTCRLAAFRTCDKTSLDPNNEFLTISKNKFTYKFIRNVIL